MSLHKLVLDDSSLLRVGYNCIPEEGWKNVTGTSDRDCPCGGWLKHWENISGYIADTKCKVVDCLNKAEVGAHVTNPKVQGEYIAPMCKTCNANKGSFSFKIGTILVSANKAKTCKK